MLPAGRPDVLRRRMKPARRSAVQRNVSELSGSLREQVARNGQRPPVPVCRLARIRKPRTGTHVRVCKPQVRAALSVLGIAVRQFLGDIQRPTEVQRAGFHIAHIDMAGTHETASNICVNNKQVTAELLAFGLAAAQVFTNFHGSTEGVDGFGHRPGLEQSFGNAAINDGVAAPGLIALRFDSPICRQAGPIACQGSRPIPKPALRVTEPVIAGCHQALSFLVQRIFGQILLRDLQRFLVVLYRARCCPSALRANQYSDAD